jgi:hypothetical protein
MADGMGMTKPSIPVPAAASLVREPRAFTRLAPLIVTAEPVELDVRGRALLAAEVMDHIPALVRALVNHTIALQNRRGLESGNRQPIQLSVLNRRRRAARTWLLAIVGGDIDRATLHAVSRQWLPTLAGNVDDAAEVRRQAASCIEFVRGAITGLLFDSPTENLLGHARALHVLELVLGLHLAAIAADS